MPGLNLITIATSIIVLMLLALPFAVARLPYSRQPTTRFADKSGCGPGFTYALVPPGGHREEGDDQERGSWQWCLVSIPDKTAEGRSEMPPWWAPVPPWNETAEHRGRFEGDADALQAVLEETSAYPAAR